MRSKTSALGTATLGGDMGFCSGLFTPFCLNFFDVIMITPPPPKIPRYIYNNLIFDASKTTYCKRAKNTLYGVLSVISFSRKITN